MDRKAIAGLLAGCEPDQMLKFRDEGDLVVVIVPDGRKYKYTNAQLEAAEPEQEPKAVPKAKAPAKAPAKRRAAARKPATKSSGTKPESKP